MNEMFAAGRRLIFRFVAFLCCAAVLGSVCGCAIWDSEMSDLLAATDSTDGGSDSDSGESSRSVPFTLAYDTRDALDPFTASSTLNTALLRLCYSGLFDVDSSYCAVPVIAQSFEVSENEVLITLRDGAKFSDGSAVTANDCVESYRRAKKSDSVWSSSFDAIRSFSAVNETTFRVVFYAYNEAKLNLLTVPIVKAGTGSEDPIGCGRYRFSDGKDRLVATDCGCFSGTFEIQTVELLGVSGTEELLFAFNSGSVQALPADLSEGAAEYRANCEIVTTVSTRLTFLVVNRCDPALSSAKFSAALNVLFDRDALADTALHSYATAVWYPLNPAWETTVRADLNADIRSPSAASEALTDAGWVLDGERRLWNGRERVLRITVNRENQPRLATAYALCETLNAVGISAEVTELSFEDYLRAVEAGEYDLYIGEIRFSADQNLSAVFSETICGVDADPDGVLATAAIEVANGSVSVRDFVSLFRESLPFLPLYYADDAIAVNMSVTGTFGGSVSDPYAGIENWHYSSN